MSEQQINKVIIVGAGGIGRAVGLLLAEHADFKMSIYLGDRDILIAGEAASWINEGNTKGVHAFAFQLLPGYEDQTNNHFIYADIILDCLPGTEAPRMGAIAKKYVTHYVNLTEYVNETEQLKQLSEDADTGFILQSGLAPGFVNILAQSLYNNFVIKYKNEQVEYIGMKVGALTEHAESPHFYGFTWSPVGVATEYLKDAWIVDDFIKKTVPSLSDRKSIIINGITYEEDYTSGGAADLPDVFSGKARKLDYKTLRYPGHYKWIQSILDQVPENEEPVQFLESQMLSTIPLIEEDIVVIYCIVKGFDHTDCLRSIEEAFKIGPTKVGKAILRAIQSTTAAPMAECARMLLSGKYKGTILQSHIDPLEFLNGPFVQAVYFPDHNKSISNESRNVVVRVAV